MQVHNPRTESYGITDPESYGIVYLESYGITDPESYGITDLESYGITDLESCGITGPESHGIANSEHYEITDPEYYGITDLESNGTTLSRFTMDVESFLTAQLWLHAVHPDAWPAEASPSITATASAGRASASSDHGRNSGDDLENVILSGARCCLLLSDDITAPTRRRHRLRFLATNARQLRERVIGNPGFVRAGVQGSDVHDMNGRVKLSRPEGEGVDSTGEFDFGLAIVQGLVSTSSGDRATAAAAGTAEAGLHGDGYVSHVLLLSPL